MSYIGRPKKQFNYHEVILPVKYKYISKNKLIFDPFDLERMYSLHVSYYKHGFSLKLPKMLTFNFYFIQL